MKSNRFKKAGILVLFLSFLVCLAACQSRINKENYDKIQRGMTEEEVTAILGKPTDTASVEIGPVSGSSATWKGKEAVITVKYLHGKVRAKGFTRGKK
jgi:hypothetical protein